MIDLRAHTQKAEEMRGWDSMRVLMTPAPERAHGQIPQTSGDTGRLRSSDSSYRLRARSSALTSAADSLTRFRHSSTDRLSRARTPPALKLESS